jgi:hypothetical protein
MRPKLNEVVLVSWSDAPADKGIVVCGTAQHDEYKIFFPNRKSSLAPGRRRLEWISTDQIRPIRGGNAIRNLNLVWW